MINAAADARTREGRDGNLSPAEHLRRHLSGGNMRVDEQAGRNDNIHGDEGQIDDAVLEPYLERSLDDVVQTILGFGQYPQPSKFKYVHRQFDLYDFVDGEYGDKYAIDHSDLREFFCLAITDPSRHGAFSYQRDKWEKKITAQLIEFLKDSDIVGEKALELYREDRDE